MFNFWASEDGDMADMGETGDWGFLRGTGGFRTVEVAKVLKILENFIIPALWIVNYYILH